MTSASVGEQQLASSPASARTTGRLAICGSSQMRV
jgi:hypothetical protein